MVNKLKIFLLIFLIVMSTSVSFADNYSYVDINYVNNMIDNFNTLYSDIKIPHLQDSVANDLSIKKLTGTYISVSAFSNGSNNFNSRIVVTIWLTNSINFWGSATSKQGGFNRTSGVYGYVFDSSNNDNLNFLDVDNAYVYTDLYKTYSTYEGSWIYVNDMCLVSDTIRWYTGTTSTSPASVTSLFYIYSPITASAYSSLDYKINTLSEEFNSTTSSVSEKLDDVISNQNDLKNTITEVPSENETSNAFNSVFNIDYIDNLMPNKDNPYQSVLNTAVSGFSNSLTSTKNTISTSVNGVPVSADISDVSLPPFLKQTFLTFFIGIYVWHFVKYIDKKYNEVNKGNLNKVVDEIVDTRETDIF